MARLYIDNLGGTCPVQAEGTIDGKEFYFRARGNKWSFEVAETGWYYCEHYGDGAFGAGFMTEEEALKFIVQAADKYLSNDLDGMAESLERIYEEELRAVRRFYPEYGKKEPEDQ